MERVSVRPLSRIGRETINGWNEALEATVVHHDADALVERDWDAVKRAVDIERRLVVRQQPNQRGMTPAEDMLDLSIVHKCVVELEECSII